ncbi:unnamed protein product [Amaranthus hypochondriacus]
MSNSDSVEEPMMGTQACLTTNEGNGRISASVEEMEEGTKSQLDSLRRQFNQLKEVLENLDSNQSRVPESIDCNKQMVNLGTMANAQQEGGGNGEHTDGNTTQLEDLKKQLNQLRDMLVNLDRKEQENNKTPNQSENTAQREPIATWKDKVLPKLSQKDKNQPQATTSGADLDKQTGEQKRSSKGSIGRDQQRSEQQAETKTSKEGSSETRDQQVGSQQQEEENQNRETEWITVQRNKAARRTNDVIVGQNSVQRTRITICLMRIMS